MFSIQVGWNINMIKRLHKNVKKLLNFQIWESKFWNCTWKVKQNIKNAEIIQCFFRPTKKANYSNEISTVHMPNSPQIQTNKTKETQQLTWSFVSKSLPSKKSWDFVYSKVYCFKLVSEFYRWYESVIPVNVYW